MKSFLSLVFVLAFAVAARADKVSQRIIHFVHENDPTKWAPHVVEISDKNVIFNLIPEGQTDYSWRERVTEYISFTKKSVPKFSAEWKAKLLKTGPDATFADTTLPDGSLFVEYYCKSLYDSGYRHYIQGPDGIYCLEYSIRPLMRTDEKLNYWKKIVQEATITERPKGK